MSLPQPLGKGANGSNRGPLIDQMIKAVLARSPPTSHLRLDVGEACPESLQSASLKAVNTVQMFPEHPAILEFDHPTSTVRPSYAGRMPAGSLLSSSACPVSCVRWVRYVRRAPSDRAVSIASEMLM